jgi:hypothetical protein
MFYAAVYSTKSSVHLTNEHLRLALGHRQMFTIRSGPDRGPNERIELFVEFQTFTHDFEDNKLTFSTIERGELTAEKFIVYLLSCIQFVKFLRLT